MENLPYHRALSLYCSEKEWGQLSLSDKVPVLRQLGIRDMNVLIQCILWPPNKKQILDLEQFHVDMIRLFEAVIRGDTKGIWQKELLYLIPRGHLKTQIITTAGAIWTLLNDPNESILINSQHLDLAERITNTIRDVYRYNRLFRACYPEWCPPPGTERGWESQSRMTICCRTEGRKEPSIMAGSFEAPKTGDHFGVILNDDPHNEKNVSTIDQIQKVKDGWEAQEPLGDGDRTRRIYVATRWHYGDVNDHIMQRRAPAYYKDFVDKRLLYNKPLVNMKPEDPMLVYLLSVWANEEKTGTIWPAKRSVEGILDTKASMGSYFFSCQYENDPVPPEDRTFDPKDFRYYTVIKELDTEGRERQFYMAGDEKVGEDPDTGRPIMRNRKIPVDEVTNYLTVDPAYGKEKHNDYNGMVVCGHWTDPKTKLRWLIVLEVVRQKLTTAQSKRKIEELYAKWDCRAVGIEANALQKTYVEQLQRDPRWSGKLRINLVPIRRGSPISKGERVTRLESYYETHRIWHHPRMRNGILEQELLAFVGAMSRGQSDDVADAMSDHVDFANVRKKSDFDPLRGAKQALEMRPDRSLQRRSSRDKRDLWRVI